MHTQIHIIDKKDDGIRGTLIPDTDKNEKQRIRHRW